ncbi:MAG TPA: hypothetical protein VG939_11395 [Caulobacteraceae bacterium]|nr:hypothetical protein [Caulobacteraceae bacterium]
MKRLALLLALLPAAALAAEPPAPPEKPPPARLFVSPSGEPFRLGPGVADPFDAWFDHADTNHDGRIDRAEFRADAKAFFARLDTDHDGRIDGFEIGAYERDVVPELAKEAEAAAFAGAVRVYRGGSQEGGGGRRRGGRGGEHESAETHGVEEIDQPRGPGPEVGHASILNEPEPVSGADLDLDGKVSAAEWAAATDRRFDDLDPAHLGYLTRQSLIDRLPKPAKPKKRRR